MTHGKWKLVVLTQPQDRGQKSSRQQGSPMMRVRGGSSTRWPVTLKCLALAWHGMRRPRLAAEAGYNNASPAYMPCNQVRFDSFSGYGDQPTTW